MCTKVCRICGIEKPIEEFRESKQTITYRRRSECRECEKLYERGKRIAHKTAPPKSKCCDLCGAEGYLVMDHCHDTLIFRGWLCRKCNQGLGAFLDDINILQKAIHYLTTYETTN